MSAVFRMCLAMSSTGMALGSAMLKPNPKLHMTLTDEEASLTDLGFCARTWMRHELRAAAEKQSGCIPAPSGKLTQDAHPVL